MLVVLGNCFRTWYASWPFGVRVQEMPDRLDEPCYYAAMRIDVLNTYVRQNCRSDISPFSKDQSTFFAVDSILETHSDVHA